MSNRQKWTKFLSNQRLGQICVNGDGKGRTKYQMDFDRIVFSSAFRRLHDKTQVFPLAESDYVRTRLTHSIEVSCVGRSLGTIVGEKIIEKYKINDFQAADFGDIVAAASLSHDIGNPPFGHSGEDAIRSWFSSSDIGKQALEELNENQTQDFLQFDGNAQGFRVLTRLQNPDNRGGLQLTCAVLASFMKYPRESYIDQGYADHRGVSLEKNGFFQAEKDYFMEVASNTGLKERVKNSVWQRHPLAFLVEAADDICYRIIDFEDGFRLGHMGYEKTSAAFLDLLDDSEVKSKINKIIGKKEKIEYLRAKSINTLVNAVCDFFIQNEEAIVEGNIDKELISKTEYIDKLDQIKRESKRDIYSVQSVLEIEAAGYEVLGGMLDLFVDVVTEVAKEGDKASPKSKKILQLIPIQFLGKDNKPDPDPYIRLLNITDFVSGMTDTFAVSTFKKFRGISLPKS